MIQKERDEKYWDVYFATTPLFTVVMKKTTSSTCRGHMSLDEPPSWDMSIFLPGEAGAVDARGGGARVVGERDNREQG